MVDLPMSNTPQLRRGPWSADEQRAIAQAIAEGRITRSDNGFWASGRSRSFFAASLLGELDRGVEFDLGLPDSFGLSLGFGSTLTHATRYRKQGERPNTAPSSWRSAALD
jgi:hypothetical protein